MKISAWWENRPFHVLMVGMKMAQSPWKASKFAQTLRPWYLCTCERTHLVLSDSKSLGTDHLVPLIEECLGTRTLCSYKKKMEAPLCMDREQSLGYIIQKNHDSIVISYLWNNKEKD